MSVACNDLPLTAAGQPPSTLVTISMAHGDQWIKISQTEVIEDSREPLYLTTIAFDSDVEFNMVTTLMATVMSVDKATYALTMLGKATFTVRDIVSQANNELKLPLISPDNDSNVGKLTVLLWELESNLAGVDTASPPFSPSSESTNTQEKGAEMLEEMVDSGSSLGNPLLRPPSVQSKPKANTLARDPVLKTLYSGTLSKSYRFPDADYSPLYVQEVMSETSLSLNIPQQMLQIYIDDEMAIRSRFKSLGKLSEKWNNICQELLELHQSIIDYYLRAQQEIRLYKGPNFRSSILKSKKTLEFVPINLHLQRMRVQSSKSSEICYDVITFGAPAAHTLKFKNGGLTRLLQQQGHQTHNISVQSNSATCVDKIEQVTTLHNSILFYSNKLQLASLDDVYLSLDDVKTWCQKIIEKTKALLAICDYQLLPEAYGEWQQSLIEGSRASSTRPTQAMSVCDPTNPDLPDTLVWSQGKFVPSLETPSEKRAWSNECGEVKQLLVQFQDSYNSNSMVNSTSEWMTHLSPLHLELNDKLNSFCENAIKCFTFLQIKTDYSTIGSLFHLTQRRDMVFSHAMSALVTGVITKLNHFCKDKDFTRQVANIGILLHFESLLSPYGNEMGMLEDMCTAVLTYLNNVVVRIVCSTSDTDFTPVIKGSRNQPILEVPLPAVLFVDLPPEIQKRQIIRIVPVLFTIGINEEATLAETIGDTSLQEAINRMSLSKIRSYYEHFIQNDCKTCNNRRQIALDPLIKQLQEQVMAKKSKNVEILQLSAQLCRQMNGVRFTSCKSAKDRSSMAVTLEQCLVLQQEHNLSPEIFNHLLNTMRSEGTRRDNLEKNLGPGRRKYAFNNLQIKVLPKLYRPPERTHGNYET